MSYLMHGQWWPQFDPLTSREVCHLCWNQAHAICGNMHDSFGHIKCGHVCVNGVGIVTRTPCKQCSFECDCLHLYEANFANEERSRSLTARREKGATLREQAADENNPLRAVNDGYKPREKKVRA
jgi:hypothetical protein